MIRTAPSKRRFLLVLPPSVAVGVMTLLNPNWLFPNIGWLDPWIYTSLSRTWGDPAAWVENYKSSRLGWVVPAWFLHPATGTFWGHLVVTAILLTATGVVIGFAVGRLNGMVPGAVSGLLAAGWCSLQLSGNANYHNQIAGLWFGLALLALTQLQGGLGKRRATWGVVASGVFFGLAVHSTPVMLNLAPFVIIFAAAASPCRPTLRRAGALAGGWIAGILGTTGILMLLAQMAGRDAFFFTRGANLATGLLANPNGQSNWWMQISWDWPVTATNMVGYAWHLIVVVLGVIGALAVLVIAWRRPTRFPRSAVVIAVGTIVTFLIFVMWQVAGQTSLEPDYFAYSLGLCTAIGIGIVAARPTGSPEASWLQRPWPAAIALAVVGLLFALPLVFMPALPNALRQPTYGTWLLAVALGVIGIGFLLFSKQMLLAMAAILLLGSANLVTAARNQHWEYSWSPTECRGQNGRNYDALIAMNQWVEDSTGHTLGRSDSPILWWPASAYQRPHSACMSTVKDFAISAANTGYSAFQGMPYGEPRRLARLPVHVLRAAIGSSTPIVIVGDSSDPSARLPEHERIALECKYTRSFPLSATSDLDACIAYVVPRAHA